MRMIVEKLFSPGKNGRPAEGDPRSWCERECPIGKPGLVVFLQFSLKKEFSGGLALQVRLKAFDTDAPVSAS